jgi:hypothetical protein
VDVEDGALLEEAVDEDSIRLGNSSSPSNVTKVHLFSFHFDLVLQRDAETTVKCGNVSIAVQKKKQRERTDWRGPTGFPVRSNSSSSHLARSRARSKNDEVKQFVYRRL